MTQQEEEVLSQIWVYINFSSKNNKTYRRHYKWKQIVASANDINYFSLNKITSQNAEIITNRQWNGVCLISECIKNWAQSEKK